MTTTMTVTPSSRLSTPGAAPTPETWLAGRSALLSIQWIYYFLLPQILGPKKKKVTNVGDFFKAFREAGAEEVDPSESGESSSRGPAFSGGGFRLGSDETPSAMIGGPSTSASKEDKPRRFVLKMWRDGFSIDDGDIRLYNDPQHRYV